MKKNNLEQLSQLAFDAQKNSHSPYSNFKVGAAVLTPSGETFSGCNVESAAFPLGQWLHRDKNVFRISLLRARTTSFAFHAEDADRKLLNSPQMKLP